MNSITAAWLLLLASAISFFDRGISQSRLKAITNRSQYSTSAPRILAVQRKLIFTVGCSIIGLAVALIVNWISGFLCAIVLLICCYFQYQRRKSTQQSTDSGDYYQLAALLDLLAVCLRAGLPVSTAIRVIAKDSPRVVAKVFQEAADLLSLGADPVDAWTCVLAEPMLAPLARGARRTAKSGTALASVATNLANDMRTKAADALETKSQRAAVLIAGPLALCFLPAFFCLGIVPVVLGLMSRLLIYWQ